eukprot:31349-Pelagococcus_subviridis.AAC.13
MINLRPRKGSATHRLVEKASRNGRRATQHPNGVAREADCGRTEAGDVKRRPGETPRVGVARRDADLVIAHKRDPLACERVVSFRARRVARMSREGSWFRVRVRAARTRAAAAARASLRAHRPGRSSRRARASLRPNARPNAGRRLGRRCR